MSKIILNRTGVKELLQSDDMMQVCKEHAYKAQSQLGDGYEVTYRKGKNRVNAEVAAVSDKARSENMKKNTILKAVMGA